MLISKLILERTDPTIGWGFITHKLGEIKPYIQKNYFDTGKLIVRGTTVSDDQLILISASQWLNNEEREKYNKDPVISEKHKLLRQYWAEKLITARWENYEYKDGALCRKWSGVLVENGIVKI